MSDRRRLRRALPAIAVVAFVAHVAFWYLPRARPAAPPPDLAASSPGARVAVWIPYPHQNLALLDRRVGGLRAWVRRLDPASGVDLPSFGPFLVPPASELRAEVGADGASRVEARLYPTVAALARAAGAVAGNAWLAGGEPPDRPGTSIRWRGRIWSLRQALDERLPVKGVGGASAASTAAATVQKAPAFPSMEVFGLIWLGQPVGPLPAGNYGVVGARGPGESVELVSAAALASPARSWDGKLVDPEAGAPVGWRAERDASGRVRAIAVWEGASGVRGLPALAVFDSPDAPPAAGEPFAFELPGESLLGLVGEKTPESTVSGLRIRALDRGTVERAAGWAPTLARAIEPGVAERAALAAAAPGPLARLLDSAAGILRSIPFVDPREGARLAAAAALLEPVGDCSFATFEAGGDGSVRLRPCASTVLSGGRSD